jgi:hypothetical protein
MNAAARLLPMALLALCIGGSAGFAQSPAAMEWETPAEAPPRPPLRAQAFASPEQGFAALIAALRASDEGRLLGVLGADARRLLHSGDRVADRAARERFLAAYDVTSAIERPAPDRAVLSVGTDAWPLPIPMVQRGGVWRFDTRRGVRELIDRRIGRNELDTIEVLRAIAAAQEEYAATAGRQGGFRLYARRFFSTPGERDGLYWPGLPESPLGPLAAQASAGGYARGNDGPRPFHGYLFRILEAQGPEAPGGALDYVVNGRMIGGFAVLATPARYGDSGIMSFLISHQGIVYQANLGPETARRAAAISRFDPGAGWEAVPPAR